MPAEGSPGAGSPLARFVVRFIETYRAEVSPRLNTECRLEPSCSAYALEAVRRHGALGGTFRSLSRLLRCAVAPPRQRRPSVPAAPSMPYRRPGPSRAIALLGALLLLAVLLAAPTQAVVTGNCRGTFNGIDAATISATDPNSAVVVDIDDAVRVEGSAGVPLRHVNVSLVFFDLIPFTAHDEDTTEQSWSGSVDVADYAWLGVGLYLVRVTLQSQTGDCVLEGLVDVAGDPLSTLGGLGGVAAMIIGFLLMTATGLWPRGGICCSVALLPAVTFTLAAMAGIGGVALLATMAPEGVPPPRRRGGLRITVLGIVAGLLFGFGVLVLLQQYGIVYPTREITGIGLLGGVFVGVLEPTLISGVRRR